MQPEQQQRIMGYFIEEAKDHLNTIEQGLLNLQSTVEDPELLAEIFRAAHSVKGGAAMLGLSSIQKTAHKLEDSFKIFQEVPVQVDGDLESLFWRIFNALKELLEETKTPTGLTEEKGAEVSRSVEPAMEQLDKHLAQLVKQSSGKPKRSTVSNRTEPGVKQRVIIENGDAKGSQEDSARELIFKSDVPALLREMLHLFKQPDDLQNREQMQEICRKLILAGEQFDLPLWCNLVETARQAIANPDKTYHALAPVLLKEIKHAQENVLSGRPQEITISAELQALVPAKQAVESSTDLTLEDGSNRDLDSYFMSNNSSKSNVNKKEVSSQRGTGSSAFPEKQEKWGEDKRPSKPTYHSGPEVGAAELNSLADLFEGEATYFNENWEEDEETDETIISGSHDLNRSSDSENYPQTSEFEDLLFEQTHKENPTGKTADDDLTSLFGLEALVDMDGAHGSDLDLPNPQLPTASSDEKLDDLGDLFEEAATEELKTSDEWEELWDMGAEEAAPVTHKTTKDTASASQEKPLRDRNTFHTQGSGASVEEEDSDFSDLLAISSEPSDRANSWEEPMSPDSGVDLEELFGDPTAQPLKNSELEAETLDLLAHNNPEEVETEQEDFAELFGATQEDDNTDEFEAAEDLEDNWLNFDESGDDDSTPEVFEALGGLFDEAQQGSVDEFNFPQEEVDEDSFESELLGLQMLNADDEGDSLLDETDNSFASAFEEVFGLAENTDADLGWDAHDTPEEETTDFYQNLEELFDLSADDSGTGDDDERSWVSDDINAPGDGTIRAKQGDRSGAVPEVQQAGVDFDELFGSLDDSAYGDGFEIAERKLPIPISHPAEATRATPSVADTRMLSGNVSFDELKTLLAIGTPTASFEELEALLGNDGNPAPDRFPQTARAGVSVESETHLGHVATQQGSRVKSQPASSAKATVSPSKANVIDFGDMEELIASAEGGHGGMPGRLPTRVSRGYEQTMRVPVRQLDNLSNLVGELVVNRNSIEQNQERMRQFLDNLLHQVSQLTDVGQRMQDLYERSLLEISLLASRQSYHFIGGTKKEANNGSGTEDWNELEMDRFTPFHTLSQDIIELIVRVRESASDIEFLVDETEQVTRQLRQVTTQLQEGLTRSRMVPFAQTADRLPRGVRDNAIKFGKQVELQVEGRETLIDKMILEQLTDPMTHLVNNALAHGIESPEERQKKGKPPVGRITIRAFHQGNQTVISVSDDGAGIDPEKVKAKALQKKLITPEYAKSMSKLDVYDLLFMAGFSTKDQADDLAGRGVGMDVVRTRLSEIRGVVNIDSTLGRGTTFTIRLPLTLSISKALCCISDRARIAFPMDGVEDMLDVPRDRIQTKSDGQTYIPWRDTMLPFRHLRELLMYNRHLGRGGVYGTNPEEDIVSVVVLRSAGNYLALQLDQVLGEQEIVIKQLEGPVPKPVGIAGATVMGDGRIVAIADVLELIDLAAGRLRRESSGNLWDENPVGVQPEPVETAIEPTVLIVDDSITVRELLSMTFNKAGYRVEQARDGQEAWEKMRSGLPCDLVFCDIEMPRMDGLELLSRMQKDPQLNKLPIAMLTSRGADKHRQMAIQMGASGYFTKPYLEESLLEAAGRMLKGEKLVSLKAEA